MARTDLPLAAIAERSGFKHQEYMGAVFKSRVGTTPARWRSQVQPRYARR
ncbi:MAG: helix-turn-helix domain-containing protein [Gammaproteobacteria bacterium]|nr:helix-turn-helix domain-containing protein [Gammaproteobacteria bacterium]